MKSLINITQIPDEKIKISSHQYTEYIFYLMKVPPAGLEPATFGSTVRRSAKLS